MTLDECNASAKRYGYGVDSDGVIVLRNGQRSQVAVRFRRGRMLVYGKGDTLLFTGKDPESLGEFLERFWFAVKKPVPA